MAVFGDFNLIAAGEYRYHFVAGQTVPENDGLGKYLHEALADFLQQSAMPADSNRQADILKVVGKYSATEQFPTHLPQGWLRNPCRWLRKVSAEGDCAVKLEMSKLEMS